MSEHGTPPRGPAGRMVVGRMVIGRELVGKVMVGISVLGLVASIVAAVVAWQVIGQLGRSVDESLAVGVDALATVELTLDVADDVVTAVDDGLGSVGATLDAVADLVDEVVVVSGTTAELAADVGPAIARIDDALGTLEGVTGTVDRVLRQLSGIPFGPSYDPEVPLDETIAAIRDDLAPLADSLLEAGSDLEGFVAGSAVLRAELDALNDDVARVRSSLAGSGELIESYRRSAGDALVVSARSRDDLDADVLRARVLVVALAATFAAGQIVPAWLGRELIAGRS